MDLLLGNRSTLKKFILPQNFANTSSATVPDATMDALGLGVAGLFEGYCGRKFARTVNDQVIFSGDRLTYILPRYPVEEIATVEFRAHWTYAWSALTVADALAAVDLRAGLLQFASPLGNEFSQVRVTWTGGFWIDSTEDGTGVQPDGSALLPGDLSLAWLMCCQEWWNKRDKLGLSLSSLPDAQVAIAKLDLPAGIKVMLAYHRRMQLS